MADGPRRTERERAEVGLVAAESAIRQRISSALSSAGFELGPVASSLEALSTDFAGSPPRAAVFAMDGSATKLAAAVRGFRKQLPETAVVVVWRSGKDAGVRRLIAAGADGIVLEPEIERTLAIATTAACAGQLVMPRRLAAAVQKPVLSAREKQVLGMVVMGLANAEIAGRLYVTESTVKSHLGSAFKKLGVGSRNEAAAAILDPELALGTGILKISDD